MTIDTRSNNLITRTISTGNTPKATEKTDNNQTKVKPNTNNADEIILSSKKNTKRNISANIINAFTSGIIIAGIFFLPDIISAIKNKKISMDIDKYNNFKPIIGDTITSRKQEQLSKKRVKITLEAIKGKFKENEILIMDKQGLIKQRVVIKKEKMSNGKEIIRHIKSYKGHNLKDNLVLKKREDLYLFKEFKRTPTEDNKSTVYISRKDKKPEIFTYFSSKNGETILRSQETGNHRENVLFLFDSDTCIGTDKQLLNKETKEQYNILNIPSHNIFNKKYNLKDDGRQYDDKLLKKFLDNF